MPRRGYTLIPDRITAVLWFESFVAADPIHFRELRGKNLACWCGLRATCHADILLRVANSESRPSPPL